MKRMVGDCFLNKKNWMIIPAIIILFLIFFVGRNAGDNDKKHVLPLAEAGSGDNLSGYAWSDNVGWISFNCSDLGTCGTSDYGVNIEDNGDLTGYAWSDNVGWISFNESDLSGCPLGTCKAKLDGSDLRGWARVLSNGDGWDGWISLDCEVAGVCGDSNYGVVVNGNALENYAWGGEVVGWIKFNPVLGGVFYGGDALAINILSVSSVLTGNKPNANWETTNAVRCDLSGDNGYSYPNACASEVECQTVTDFFIDQAVLSETTYTLECFDLVDDSATVIFTPLENFYLSGNPTKVRINFAGGGATTTPTTIGVISWNGFNGNVTLSANLDELPVGSQEVFSTGTLTSPYASGSELKFFIPDPFTGQKNAIVIGSNSGETITDNLTIIIDTGTIKPGYEEI